MVFACSSGPGERLDRETPRQRRYIAIGREVVNVHSGRRQSPPRAREALTFLVESVLATSYESLVETDLLVIGDLVRAIRAAERNDPTPPAAFARAA